MIQEINYWEFYVQITDYIFQNSRGINQNIYMKKWERQPFLNTN